MRLSAIALDYDGTITRCEVMDPGVRAAIEAARAKGLIVLLVTGRILEELRRVAGDLRLFDVIVAENGAVVYFVSQGRSLVLAPPISPEFVHELQRRSIPHRCGQCLVDAAAAGAPRLLELIRTLEERRDGGADQAWSREIAAAIRARDEVDGAQRDIGGSDPSGTS